MEADGAEELRKIKKAAYHRDHCVELRKKTEFHIRFSYKLSQIDAKTTEKAEFELFFPPKDPVNAKMIVRKAIKRREVEKELDRRIEVEKEIQRKCGAEEENMREKVAMKTRRKLEMVKQGIKKPEVTDSLKEMEEAEVERLLAGGEKVWEKVE